MSAGSRAITPQEVTPEWLTELLRRQNALPTGEVVAIEARPNSAFNSHTLHLTPVYSETDSAATPAHLLLKCSLEAAWAQRAGAREVAFYQMVAALPDHPEVIVRCYDAAYDPTTGNSHLLLEELSESHEIALERDKQITMIDNLPTDSHLEQAVGALARFHAYWWQHPRLGTESAPIAWGCLDEETYTVEVTRRGQALHDLFAHESDWFPPHLQTLYESVLNGLLPLWRQQMQARITSLTNLTLTHGDAYLANFLCPRQGRTGSSYIIDWQSPETYRGPTDLVNMCATFWTREQRAQGERELNVLRHYHRTLREHGVSGYAWDDLVTDYRLSIVDWLWVPVQDRMDGSGKSYWWPKMLCLTQAFEDWQCADLFTDLLADRFTDR